jgi:xanthine dehydrogenase small subunit
LLQAGRWTADAVECAAVTLADEFTPIDDLRASAAYRRVVLGNLLRRCFHETRGAANIATRVDAPQVAASVT